MNAFVRASSGRILHIITGLPVGGAQTVLSHIVRSGRVYGYDSHIISLTEIGSVGKELSERWDIPVQALDLSRAVPNPFALTALANRINKLQPSLVQTWMYHADLMGGVANRLARRVPLLWNIRQSNLDPRYSKSMTVWTARACALLSAYLPDRIVCVSDSAQQVHTKLGYSKDKIVVIPNGVDFSRFKPDRDARSRFREALNEEETTPIIGYAARWDPQKDHACFIRAAGNLLRKRSDVRFVLCGEGMVEANEELGHFIESEGIRESVHLLGLRDDMHEVFPGLDIVASTARYGEGFPNVLAEALACGLPCTTTDVGDSSTIVGDAGSTLPVGDDEALARCWNQILSLSSGELKALKEKARERAVERLDVGRMIDRYYELYGAVISGRRLTEI